MDNALVMQLTNFNP